MSRRSPPDGPAIGPHAVDVIAGETYFWCSCGKSAQQPFCDGSHKGSRFAPLKFKATESRTLLFCGCKHTGSPPFCDGSHQQQEH
jgi:CDGSH-type Zn-finger protein